MGLWWEAWGNGPAVSQNSAAVIKLPSVTSHQQDFLLRLCKGWWLFNNSIIVSIIMQFDVDLLWRMNQDFVTGSHKESVTDGLEFLCRNILKHFTLNINNVHKLVMWELFYHSRPDSNPPLDGWNDHFRHLLSP